MISPKHPRYSDYMRVRAQLFNKSRHDRSSGHRCSEEEIDRQVLARVDCKQRGNGAASSPRYGVIPDPLVNDEAKPNGSEGIGQGPATPGRPRSHFGSQGPNLRRDARITPRAACTEQSRRRVDSWRATVAQGF